MKQYPTLKITPANKNKKAAFKNSSALYAANGSRIDTFGSSRLNLDLGLRRAFTWDFIVADSEYNIRGADILYNFNLIVDLKRQMIIDNVTKLKVKAQQAKNINFLAPRLFNFNDTFGRLLAEFPSVTRLQTLASKTNTKSLH